MKTKMLLCMSALLNVTLLGGVTYLSRKIPEQNYIPPDIRIVAKSTFGAEFEAADRTSPDPILGKAIEVLLLKPRNTDRPELFDFETGRQLAEPDYEYFGRDARANIAWIRTNGLDISGFVNPDGEVLCICYYMAVVPVDSKRWEQATAAGVLGDPELARIQDPKRTVIMPKHHKTDTFLFRTREGSQGVLQIEGPSKQPVGVKIRYKLVQPDGNK